MTKNPEKSVVCYVALGSNLGDSLGYLESAIKSLKAHESIQNLIVSRFYKSKPHGPQNQPDYINAAVRFEANLTAIDLLDFLQLIEKQNDREREKAVRWGARTLDLDLLFYADEIIKSGRLTVPHPRICERAFVLYPLNDLHKNLKFPDGATIKGCIDKLDAASASDTQVLKKHIGVSMTKRVTVKTIRNMKTNGEKIVTLTAYDASFARVIDEQGVDVILVGDSLGMVMQGHDSTVPVTVDDIIYHSKSVVPQCKRALVMADLPFMSYTNPDQAIRNAARLMQEGMAHMVKLEGGEAQLDTVRHMTRHGVPVCAHLGLTPQTVHKLGGYHVQGREKSVAKQMLADALALQDAGADAMVLECVPVDLAEQVTHELSIPTIGIGAGRVCDGQVLVLQDMIGISSLAPKFTFNFMCEGRTIPEAIAAYVKEVRKSSFPTDEQCFF